MEAKLVAKICSGQDGAIWGGFFFRFQSNGECFVYELERLLAAEGAMMEPFSAFRLDKVEILMSHSNSVSFGNAYAEEQDEFPLLYTNIYNSYAKAEDRMEGTCCVYRLQRCEDRFTTQLVQVIRIGFAAAPGLWRSKTVQDVRPYGNFAIDRQGGVCYAFTMLDEEQRTRYFSFRPPHSSEGQWDGRLSARIVVLNEADIVDTFDCPYHHYVQGACVHEKKIYSLEGFADDAVNPPALRIIDPKERRQMAHILMKEAGLVDEPEWIDFYNGRCMYADHTGNVYQISY